MDGADPYSQDNDGLSPAMWACHFDQLDNLQLLLAVQDKSNPSPEARFQSTDETGRTILHWAVTRMNNTDCMKVRDIIIIIIIIIDSWGVYPLTFVVHNMGPFLKIVSVSFCSISSMQKQQIFAMMKEKVFFFVLQNMVGLFCLNLSFSF